MSDELSMHLLTTPLIYRLLSFNATPEKTRLIGIVLSIMFTVVMVTHMVMDEFLLHATTFGLGIYVIATRVLKIIPQQVKDPATKKKFQNIAVLGLGSFGFGYMVWLIDEFACRYLTNARHAIGLPFAFLLELHGWWHVLTAIGGYTAVAVIDIVTTGEVTGDPTDTFAWPVPLALRLMSNRESSVKQK
ncbi:hypothetical protein NW768_004670 [Fusarium equiseti]|uniref:Alkaline phytoceramidase n=1 Tax=Fusarium equiseti TaxID=61235 RepID=A0ABQ8RGV7_FUSEQ|nr:hypothetical protein NW768_004670 [Fusarium equiseti]